MSDDQVYEEFVEIMFNLFTEDEMAYAHHEQTAQIVREAIEEDGHA